jgi:hypothetical protein
MQLILDIDDSPIEYVSAEEEKAINSILSTLSDEDKEVVDIREYNITYSYEKSTNFIYQKT